MKKFLLVASVASAFACTAFAQENAQEKRGSDRLDLQKLEDKYWSAKDTDFSVVQNRTYSKSGRPFLSVSYGPLVNDAYSYGRMTGFSAGYYFNERIGLEISHEAGALKDNDSTVAFRQLANSEVSPDYNTFKDYTSLNFVIVPFYAKMSFWDRKIMYFDMQFALGVGQMNYTSKIDATDGGDIEGKATGYSFDVTQQLFVHENIAFRFDIKNKWTRQNLYKANIPGNNPQSQSLGTVNQQDTTILFGITFWL